MAPSPHVFAHHSQHTTPPLASGLFTATRKSLTQSVTYCLTEESLVGADLHVFLKADTSIFGVKVAIFTVFTLLKNYRQTDR